MRRRPPDTLRNIRRLVARLRPSGGMVVVGAEVAPSGVRANPQWPSLPHPVCCPGNGVELAWYGGGSYPSVDAAVVDHLIARHGPHATLRDAVPQVAEWRRVELPLGVHVALPADAELPAAELEAIRLVGDVVRMWDDVAHDISPRLRIEEAIRRWLRWWDVPRQRARALRAIRRALQEDLELVERRRDIGRRAPKYTDAVAATIMRIGGLLHGGDGNSGECDHAAETKAFGAGLDADQKDARTCERAEGGAGQNPAAGTQPACSTPGGAEPEPTALAGTGEGDRGANNPAPARGSVPYRTTTERVDGAGEAGTVDGDDPSCDRVAAPKPVDKPDRGSEATTGVAGEGGDTPPSKSEAPREGAVSSRSVSQDVATRSEPKGNCDSRTVTARPGGVYADSAAARRRAISLRGPARDVARALRRLVAREVGTYGEPSPRISGRRLVREMVGMSYRLSRAHRDEMDIGRVVIAPDLSGSCSACAPDTLAAAYAIQAAMPEVVQVIEHSNGQYHGAHGWQDLDTHPAIADGRCRCLVIYGDWDGGQVYRRIAERWPDCRIVWLDSYGKAGGVRPSCDAKRGYFKDWARPPLKFDGVGTAADAAVALRQAVRI